MELGEITVFYIVYLNKDLLLALYFSHIHSYINYANLVSQSTYRTYLRKISSQ